MTVIGDKAYIYGGMAGHGRSGVLSVMDMTTLTWTALDRKAHFGGTAPPPARAGHSFTAVGKHIFVYGGEGRPEKGPNPQADKVKGNGENKTRTLANRVDFGDFWRLDTDTMRWDQLLMRGLKADNPDDAVPGVAGHKASFPSSRREHAVTDVITTPPIVEGELGLPKQHHLWLFGGAGPDPTLGVESTFNDLWRMDVTDTGGSPTSFKWSEQLVTGSPLPRRWGHTLTYIPHSNALAIIGGEGPPNGAIDLSKEKKVVKRTIEARRRSMAMSQCEGLVVIVNLETFVCSWLNLNPVFSPGWVVGHTAAANPRMPGCVYIFGGRIASQPGCSKASSAMSAVEQAPLLMLNMRGKINDGEFDGVPCWSQVQFEVAEPPPPTPPDDADAIRKRKEAIEKAKHVPPEEYTSSGVINWEKKTKLEAESRRQRAILVKAGKLEEEKGNVKPIWSAPARREGHAMALVGNHGLLVHGGIFANLRRFKGDRKVDSDQHVAAVAEKAMGMSSMMTSAQKAAKEREEKIANTPVEQGYGHAAPNLYYLHFSHYNLAPEEHEAPVTKLNPSAMMPVKVQHSKPEGGIGRSPTKRTGNKEGVTRWGGEWQDEDAAAEEEHQVMQQEARMKKSAMVARVKAADARKQIKQSLKKQKGFGAGGAFIQNQMRRKIMAAREEMDAGLTPVQIEQARRRMLLKKQEELREMKREVSRRNAKSLKGHKSTQSIFKASCPIMKVRKGGKNRRRDFDMDDDSEYGDSEYGGDYEDENTPRGLMPTSQSVTDLSSARRGNGGGRGGHMSTSASYDADAMAAERRMPAAENLRFRMEGRDNAVHLQVPGAKGIALGSAVGLSAGGTQLSHQEARWHQGGDDNNSDFDDDEDDEADYTSDAEDNFVRPPGAAPSIFSSAAASALGRSGRSEKWSSTRVPHMGEDGIGDKGSDLSYDNFKLICGDPVKHMSTRFELDKTYKSYPALPKKSLTEMCPELKKRPKVEKWRSSMEGMPVTNSTLRQVIDDARDMAKAADCLGYPLWT
jgi:hypothetical protein